MRIPSCARELATRAIPRLRAVFRKRARDGCPRSAGDGELALALVADGYDVTAIDPRAPEGAIFRRLTLEEFDDELVGFDAVVASLSLHHVESLGVAFDKVASFLRPGGTLVLQEFARERLSGATARWYHEQRRARNEDGVPASFNAWLHEAERDLADVHPFNELRRELDRLFVERVLEEVAYLYSHRLDDAVEPVERALIGLEPSRRRASCTQASSAASSAARAEAATRQPAYHCAGTQRPRSRSGDTCRRPRSTASQRQKPSLPSVFSSRPNTSVRPSMR